MGEIEVDEWDRDFDIGQTITAGLEDDLERIMYRIFDEFADEESAGPRMTIFTQIWHETAFGLIFCGRESFREMYEFTEELFDMVKKYALSVLNQRPNHALLRYAAIYMLYALYFKQPCRPLVKIRLTLDQFTDLQETVAEAKKDKHHDVVYAWAKLFTMSAFHYVVADTQMGLEVALQLENKEQASKQAARKTENYFESKDFDKLMQQVTRAHSKYESMKTALVGGKTKDRNLFYTDGDMPHKLLELTKKTEEPQVEKGGPKDDLGERRKKIKESYFSHGTESNRDRLFAEGRNKSSGDSQEDEEQNLSHEDVEWTPGSGKSRKGAGRGRGKKRRLRGGRKGTFGAVNRSMEELGITAQMLEGDEEAEVKKRKKVGEGRSDGAGPSGLSRTGGKGKKVKKKGKVKRHKNMFRGSEEQKNVIEPLETDNV